MVRMPLVFRRHHPLQFHFHLERRLAGRQSGAVSDAEDVCIDGNRRLAESDVEDNVGGLAADTRQRLQRFARAGNLAVMLGDQLLRQRNDIFGLVTEQTDGLDQIAHPRFAERRHFLGRVCEREQRRRRLVDARIGCLRRKNHRDQQRERIDVLQFAFRLRVRSLEAAERLGNLRRCPLRQGALRRLDVGRGTLGRRLYPRTLARRLYLRTHARRLYPRTLGRRLYLRTLARRLYPRTLGRNLLCLVFRWRRSDGFSRHDFGIVSAMTHDNADDHDDNDDPTIFSATLTPHRSLSRVGFLVLMLLFGGVSFVTGMLFLVIGAWPVLGFFGLDVLLLYWAFRLNYWQAKAYEQVTVTPSMLKVRKVSHLGRAREWVLNPLWVQLDKVELEEFGIDRLFLVSRGKKLAIATFLGPDEKAGFAKELGKALIEARRGPTRTVFE
jgi:uncharacterized membrane protein